MKAIIPSLLTVTAITFALGASIAANAQDRTRQPIQPVAALSCDAQAWPAYEPGCLSTIDGNPLERPFRTVRAY